MNILLNDKERELYKGAIEELSTLCPVLITKKIPRANVQQAWMLDTVKKHITHESKILCVGCHEDTACEALLALDYEVTRIDPVINMPLEKFFNMTETKFNVIFSTSVIEHVENDELFIDQICQLLKVGGYGILTCDFNNNYIQGQKPIEDFRLYTKHDLLGRLHKILTKNNCSLVGDINYDSEPDFSYGGYSYSFATYMFRKDK